MSSENIKIFFPCIHGVASGQLVSINCFLVDELKSSIKVLSGCDEETAKRIIGATRYKETDFRAALGVMAVFSNPMFGGESFGLALAISDKIARYNKSQEWTEIYATGKIPPDKCGEVEEIRGFDEKLDLLIRFGLAGSVFVFPEQNVQKDSETQREKIDQLEQLGITCKPVTRLDELEGYLWGKVKRKTESVEDSSFMTGILEPLRCGGKSQLFYNKSILLALLAVLSLGAVGKYVFDQFPDETSVVPLREHENVVSIPDQKMGTPLQVSKLLQNLQQRSTVAIKKVNEANKNGGKCSELRKEFNHIVPLANTAAFFADAIETKPGSLAAGNSGALIAGPVTGPRGVRASLYKTVFIDKVFDGAFLQQLGWKAGERSDTSWPDIQNLELFLIIFQGTDFSEYIVGVDQALIWGGTDLEQQWALDVSTQFLEKIQAGQLALFTGHGLGGGLATYAALSLNKAAITFNSSGLHPKKFGAAIKMGRGVELKDITTDQIENIFHFISQSQDGVVDFISSTSFAGLSILAGAKYLLKSANITVGDNLSFNKVLSLHPLTNLSNTLSGLNLGDGAETITCEALHGRDIYMHPK